jgi:hypothetical protein
MAHTARSVRERADGGEGRERGFMMADFRREPEAG